MVADKKKESDMQLIYILYYICSLFLFAFSSFIATSYVILDSDAPYTFTF